MPQPAKRSRITIGDTTITYLPDGFGAHNPDVLFLGVDWTTRPGHLQDGQLLLSFGSFLIRAGDRRVLVDLTVGKIPPTSLRTKPEPCATACWHDRTP
ncbi:hypothetical protein [Streptomyces sp. LN500]|uniref:hypothetical protein n=2 Tax=unclassified Streptomyces TaxID=2593676 RepID=UPI0037144AD5